MKTILSQTVLSEAETKMVVQKFGQKIKGEDNFSVFFKGDLGAGKTFFVRSLLQVFEVKSTINSPTYTYVQEYSGHKNFAHFDLYRLNSDQEFLSKGFGEIIEDETICKLVEWPQKISNDILEEFSGTHFVVSIKRTEKDKERIIEIQRT